MRNIAIPVKELKENISRQRQIAQLRQLATIPEIVKRDKLQELDSRESEIVNFFNAEKEAYSVASKALRGAGLGKEEIDVRQEQLNQGILGTEKDTDEKLRAIYEEFTAISETMTDEDKAQRLSELDAACKQFDENYGIKPLTADDIRARSERETAEAHYAETEKYKRDRAEQYPSIGDQLGAIWKALEANRKLLPPEALSVLDDINAIKEKFPKPRTGDDRQKNIGT